MSGEFAGHMFYIGFEIRSSDRMASISEYAAYPFAMRCNVDI